MKKYLYSRSELVDRVSSTQIKLKTFDGTSLAFLEFCDNLIILLLVPTTEDHIVAVFIHRLDDFKADSSVASSDYDVEGFLHQIYNE